MMSRLFRHLISPKRKNFARNRDGNISIMFALLSVLLIALIGGAVDISNAYANKSKFQDLSDRVALAAAKGADVAEMKEIGEAFIEYYKEHDPDRFMLKSFTIEPTLVDGVKMVKVKLAAKPDTFFLHVIGMDMLPIKVTSSVSEERSDVEVSLVLDVSFSMTGNKITKLRSASNKFIDVMIGDENTSDTTSITIVPFGGNVNLGSSLANKFMPTLALADLDPDDRDYRDTVDTNVTALATGQYRFTNGMNCIETTSADHDTNMIADNSRSQLPRFVHRNSGLTICPEDASSVLFNSDNKTTLKNKIRDMVISHGTGMDVGALWGLKSLSPSFRGVIGGDFSDRPFDFRGKNQKVLVIMTDGNITGQGRPRKPNSPKRLVTGASNPGNRPVYLAGTAASTSSADDAVGRFKKVCEVAKANDIKVFTIGYNIVAGEIADQLLKECASVRSNYFFVETANIESAFESIAAKLTDLHITN